MITCSAPDCSTSHKSSKWDNRKADKHGWFHQRNGDSWCPEHVPEWLETWRAKQRGEEPSPPALRPAVGGTFEVSGELKCSRCEDWVIAPEQAGYINNKACCINCWTKFQRKAGGIE